MRLKKVKASLYSMLVALHAPGGRTLAKRPFAIKKARRERLALVSAFSELQA